MGCHRWCFANKFSVSFILLRTLHSLTGADPRSRPKMELGRTTAKCAKSQIYQDQLPFRASMENSGTRVQPYEIVPHYIAK